MHLAKLITDGFRRNSLLIISILGANSAFSQINSPYSRYGLGDWIAIQNVANKGMGGFSAAYSDYGIIGSPFNINIVNPASLGSLSNTKNFSNTIFDIGGSAEFNTLRSTTTTEKYKSSNAMTNYLQVAFPVSSQKMEKKGTSWGLSFGLRPISRISYKIQENVRLQNVDSMSYLYEGNGGLNQANISSGIRFTGKGKAKNELNLGLSFGYDFGNRDFSTRASVVNDSVIFYRGNTEVQSRFGNYFLNTGMQYEIHLQNAGKLRLGAYANLHHNLKGKQSTINETFGYDANGGIIRIDSISFSKETEGTVTIPGTYGLGFAYQSKNQNWILGADLEFTQWSQYRYFGKSDYVSDNWTIRTGAEYYPANFNAATNKYWNYVRYRAGFYYGPDYVNLNSKTRYNYAATIGTSMPLTTPRYIQARGEYVSLSTALEIGSRGNKQSQSLRESFYRFNIGISMNARWFQKRSYD